MNFTDVLLRVVVNAHISTRVKVKLYEWLAGKENQLP